MLPLHAAASARAAVADATTKPNIKVEGRWLYLCQALDERSRTVESDLKRTRDVADAKAFFRTTFRRHGEPRTITLDGFEGAMPPIILLECVLSSNIEGTIR